MEPNRVMIEEEILVETHSNELEDFDINFEGLHLEDQKTGDVIRNDHADISMSKQENVKSDIENLVRRASSKDEDIQLVDDDFAFLYYTIAGRDEKLDAFELQRVLSMVFREKLSVASDSREFSLETCRSMMASNDLLRVGKLTFVQFKVLWMKIVKWVYIFDKCERDKDGKINFAELRSALRKLKLELSEETTHRLVYRFQGRRGLVQLDDFLQICCKAESARSSFDKVKDGNATFELFFMEILYN